MEQRFYWLKLKKDFFKRHDIKIIEAMPNGKDYILFYLKLLCESVDHEGNLRFSDQIPYNEEMLSVITNTNIDIVRSAIKIFTQLNMMELMDDGTYFMSEVYKMIGSAADNDNANRQRRFRERKKEEALLNCYGSVIKNNESIDIDKDIEKDKDIDKKEIKEKVSTSVDGDVLSEEEKMFNEFWKLYPKKIAKQQCFSAYKRIPKLKQEHPKIIEALNRFIKSDQWNKSNGQFIPNPLTFIHQSRWKDINDSNIVNSGLEEFLNG